jgi:hypothetical protein
MTIFAQLKSTEFRHLYGKKYYDTAYYLSGYAVDFALKAVICKRWNIDTFDVTYIAPGNLGPLPMPQLLVFAGLQAELSDKKNLDPEFDIAWSLVSQWNEVSRYDDGCSQKTAREFLIGTNTLLSWIKTFW